MHKQTNKQGGSGNPFLHRICILTAAPATVRIHLSAAAADWLQTLMKENFMSHRRKFFKPSTFIEQGWTHTNQTLSGPCWTGQISISVWPGLVNKMCSPPATYSLSKKNFFFLHFPTWLAFKVNTGSALSFTFTLQNKSTLPPSAALYIVTDISKSELYT